MDELDRYLAEMTEAFTLARRNAEIAAEEHNRHLPTSCPQCSEPNFICGLPCLTCGAIEEERGYLVVQDTEHGYALVRLGRARRQPPIATFAVDM